MVNIKEKQVDSLLKSFGAITDEVKSSLILESIERISSDPRSRNNHTSHDNHCQFDRDGGGHINVCWADKITEELIKDTSGKDKGESR
ncbi:hypothetical protein [Wolbachia endosymbiont of Folsomia candida]|uniref:hypothetical protein n=1 Tax=Wolbachia endosymbiont of Folsomia candida TaxID=169402 RepID=UPI000A517245|nr:hypothetical protein [Wolbachia endosymbiont of Folsomia candida]APR99096.1 hypothetical protein ASM33_07920 [Wolbachia endosymbiont of Folsomia candida]